MENRSVLGQIILDYVTGDSLGFVILCGSFSFTGDSIPLLSSTKEGLLHSNSFVRNAAATSGLIRSLRVKISTAAYEYSGHV